MIKVPGFRFSGIASGVKKSRRKDLALIVSDRPAAAAGLFTTNQVKAAPVLVGMRRIKRGVLQAVVANSGNANACTGARGLKDAETMCRETASRLGIQSGLVLPSSTGIIGVPLPIDKIRRGIQQAVSTLSEEGFLDAAEAIMTTDRFAKTGRAECRLRGRRITVGGMAKGAGMIAPNMATMLAYVVTDAAVETECLRSILRAGADQIFNCVTVDGDMSTNDTVVLIANGAAGNAPIRSGTDEVVAFGRAVYAVMQELALQLVRDGEGATKVIEIRVEEARSRADARQIAFAVANSQLVKTAFFGADPNFGRIMAAVGAAGVRVSPDAIDVSFDGVKVVRRGVGIPSRERQAARVLRRPSFRVRIQLRQGSESASVWTSDLSHEYVRINSAYRT